MPDSVPSTNGVVVAVHELGGHGEPLLIAHANGFHGRVFAPLAAHLAPRYRSLAPDFRGHGDTVVPNGVTYQWSGFSDDVLAVVDALGLSGCAAVGHSMGGAALLGAEVRRPGTFRALYLYEPIVFPADVASAAAAGAIGAESDPGDSPMAQAAERRREKFGSYTEAIDNYASKPPLAALSPDALRAYVHHGFAAQPDGSVRIKCRGATEAAIYRMARHSAVFERLGGLGCPVTVATGRADDSRPGPETFGPTVATTIPHGRLERFDDLGHFGPLEDPARVAASIVAALG